VRIERYDNVVVGGVALRPRLIEMNPIDHLVWAAADLDDGMAAIERRLFRTVQTE